ncbi:hypothetical protein DAKH74_012670 [Maudiozyma humilis]|uniref:Methyltransferase type 11 domain-containing protein n=1 Tax=Maudiozyma humilis TaxID=51915 RepID=A0AAV5RU04_MAUHU|nr:hypothetical protein DAKH74_012670 [Kazachstania humilis]
MHGTSNNGPSAAPRDPGTGSSAGGMDPRTPGPFVEQMYDFDTVYAGGAAQPTNTEPSGETASPVVAYQPMRRLGSIHSRTSEIAETQMGAKKWDWNTLPSASKDRSPIDTERRTSASIIGGAPVCNIAQVSIDGEMKAIRYDPRYNRRLAQMDLFLRFNTETTQRDSLVHAKRRLKSYVKYFSRRGSSASLTSMDRRSNSHPGILQPQDRSPRASMSRPVHPRHGSLASNERHMSLNAGVSLDSSPYDQQAMEIIQLWSYQVETYFSQTNSLLFSADVTQNLVNRRSQRRKSTPNSFEDSMMMTSAAAAAGSSAAMRGTESTLSGTTMAPSMQTGTSHNTYLSPEGALLDPLEEIDVLLLRPLVTEEIGWQLAFNEPQLTVADYELNIGPWKEASEKSNDDLLRFMEGNDEHYRYNDGAVIETTEARIRYIDTLNAPRYLLDVMNRRLADYTNHNSISQELQARTKHFSSVADDVNSLTRSEHSMDFSRDTSDALSIKSYAAPSGIPEKKKKKSSKSKKGGGFVNFFRRKHTSSVPPPQQQAVASPQVGGNGLAADDPLSVHSTTPDIPSPRFLPTPPSFAFEKPLSNPPTFDSIDSSINKGNSINEHEPQNVWLENHYCEILSNYRKVDMPTQYYFPRNKATGLTPELSPNSQEALQHESSQESFSSNERINHPVATNLGNYGRELLQLKLPFRDNSVPSILCPWIWTTLTRTKWGNLLREIKRCLQPGGYVLAIATDLRVSNSDYSSAETNGTKFKTSIERNAMFDTLAIEAMNKGLHLFPTKHLAKKFKECGFVNIKTTTLSMKSGDLKSNMGCINEFMIALLWHLITGSRIARGDANDNSDLDGLVERFIKEHWEKVDNNAGCLRTTFIVAQTPKTQ